MGGQIGSGNFGHSFHSVNALASASSRVWRLPRRHAVVIGNVFEQLPRVFFARLAWAIPSAVSGLDVERANALLMGIVWITAGLPLLVGHGRRSTIVGGPPHAVPNSAKSLIVVA